MVRNTILPNGLWREGNGAVYCGEATGERGRECCSKFLNGGMGNTWECGGAN